MNSLIKPNIVISRCLGFDACRYNGQILPDYFIEELKSYVNFITVCPEVSIGLGVPREPIRVVNENNQLELFQPKTNLIFTDKINKFSSAFLENIKEVDGFILKSSSPSCGFRNVKVYNGIVSTTSTPKGNGFFGAAVGDRFPNIAIEDEGRLTNLKIRDNFLIKIFTFCDFRRVKNSNSLKELIKFHSKNKLVLMAYSQKYLSILGKIVSNSEKKTVEVIFQEYEENLQLAFAKAPKYTNNINVYVSIPIALVRSYAVRVE